MVSSTNKSYFEPSLLSNIQLNPHTGMDEVNLKFINLLLERGDLKLSFK